ncbi:MAG TPA: ThuA domain-containing protein, partial [Gemmataceae bacterium]
LEAGHRDGPWNARIPLQLKHLWRANRADARLLEIMGRLKDAEALEVLRNHAANVQLPADKRLKAVRILSQVRDPKSKDLFLKEFASAKPDSTKVAFLTALEAFDDMAIGTKILAGYAGFSPAVKKRALQALLTRPSWALGLVQQFDKGTFPKNDFTLAQAKAAVLLNDKAVTAIVEKHFGKLAPATPGEKQARIAWLNTQLGREKPGDSARGKALFTKHCAACHQLHGEGGKIGPDLTTADRKNRGYLLANIVDPSGYIRPEFVSQNVLTVDGRKLSGLAAESGGNITLTNVVNDKPEVKTIPKADIESIVPSAVSLMPEKLLEALSYQEIADLFVYLGSDEPAKTPAPDGAGSPAAKKLKVLLISGSFEYKSDDSLAALQKHLEANYSVQCTRAFAKSDKDKSLAGLENLERCDVAIFFTRRLQIDGDSLDRVKKYVAAKKPIVGIRTASHGFQNWLEFDKLVLGGDYKGHFGQNIPCDVTIDPKAKGNPVLAGVQPFITRGGLYKNANVASDVTVLLRGKIPEGSEPVAWLRDKDGRRVFYTSLGTPDDFKDPNFIRLVVNGLAWTTKRELKT